MTWRTHVVLQALALAPQFLVDDLPVAKDWHPFLHSAGAFANAILGLLAHRHNPDGTPAEVAYVRPTSKSE